MATTVFFILAVCLVNTARCQFGNVGDNCVPHLKENFGCSKHGESFTDPDNCNQYITCLADRYCKDMDPYVGYRYSSCPYRTQHNEAHGVCQHVPICPNNKTKIVDPNEWCITVGERYGIPDSCTEYIECFKNDQRTWEWKHINCSEPLHFNPKTKKCEQVPCEGCYFPIPAYAECNSANEKIGHPADCKKYFECVVNEDEDKCGAKWGRFDRNCTEGTYFDPVDKECVKATECPQVCPLKMEDQESCENEGQFVADVNCANDAICVSANTCAEEGFKPYWTAVCAACVCKEVNQTYGYASSCREHVSCELGLNKTWYWDKKKCEHGDFYNQSSGLCERDLERTCLYCPEKVTQDAELEEICTEDGLRLPYATDCRSFVLCIKEEREECGQAYMAYEIGNCGNELFYDPKEKKCVLSMACPTNENITNECIENDAKFPVTDSCTKYTVCKKNNDTEKGEWESLVCPDKQHFSRFYRTCLAGRCPECAPAPEYAKCEEKGDGHKFGNVLDCTKYFECKKNYDSCEEGLWGQREKQCRNGKYFDVVKKSCVESEDCPQECPPAADSDSECRLHGDKIGEDDCKSGFECIRVKTCKDTNYEEYWHHKPLTCSGEEGGNSAEDMI